MTSQRFTALLFALAALLGLLSALDLVTPEIGDRADLATAEAARSGSWTCPAPGVGRGSSARLVASSPPSDTGIAADVSYDVFGEGEIRRFGRVAPFAEQAVGTDLVDDELGLPPQAGVAVRWRRQPAAIGRIWLRDGGEGPTGLLAAPCIPGSSATWYVPGLSTAGGAEATVVLANPFVGDASVTLTLATPTGPEQPILLENVVVPGRSTRSLLLNEHAPERADVGVVVTTRSGRVVVEALQSVNAAIGGIEGVASVAAAPAGADSWTIAWAAADSTEVDDIIPVEIAPSTDQDAPPAAVVTAVDALPGDPTSWVWVTNVGQDDAVLLLTVHGSDGGELVELGTDPILAPGAVRRISLDGLLPATAPRAAITVATENGVPIVASIGTQVVADDEERTGVAVQLGSPSTDSVWVLPGEAPEGRRSVVALVNIGGEDAQVDLSLWSSTGIVRPEGAQGIAVPAGTQRLVDVSDLLDTTLGEQVVFVRATVGQVVASRFGWTRDSDERLDLVAHSGIPSRVWAGGTLVPTTRFDPSLTGEVVQDAP